MGGFWRILRAAPDDLCVVPIAVIYDFATTGRPRVFISVTPTIEHARALPAAELQAALRRAWLGHVTLTTTQLGSAFLMAQRQAGKHRFTSATFEEFIATEAARLAASGHHVDPALLHPARRRRRVRGFLRYAQRHGAVRPVDAAMWEVAQFEAEMRVLPGEVGYQRYPFAYAWHEYQELAEVVATPVPVEAVPVSA